MVKALRWASIEAQYRKDWKRYGERSPFLVHFRIRSHGAVSYENCHPFPLEDGGALIHNGMLGFCERDEVESDTRKFVKMLNKLPRGWEREADWCSLIQDGIGKGNKLCMLWPDGAYLILNEKEGHWTKDVWFSNYSHNSRVFSRPLDDDEVPGYSAHVAWVECDDGKFHHPDYLPVGVKRGKKVLAPPADKEEHPLPIVSPRMLGSGQSEVDRSAVGSTHGRRHLIEEQIADILDEEHQLKMDVSPGAITEAEEQAIEARELARQEAEADAFMEAIEARIITSSGDCVHCGLDLLTSEQRISHTPQECLSAEMLLRGAQTTGTTDGKQRRIIERNGHRVVIYD